MTKAATTAMHNAFKQPAFCCSRGVAIGVLPLPLLLFTRDSNEPTTDQDFAPFPPRGCENTFTRARQLAVCLAARVIAKNRLGFCRILHHTQKK